MPVRRRKTADLATAQPSMAQRANLQYPHQRRGLQARPILVLSGCMGSAACSVQDDTECERLGSRASHVAHTPCATPTRCQGVYQALQHAQGDLARPIPPVSVARTKQARRFARDPPQRVAAWLRPENEAETACMLSRRCKHRRRRCGAAARPLPLPPALQTCERARRARGRRRLPPGCPPAADLQRVLPVVAGGPHRCGQDGRRGM